MKQYEGMSKKGDGRSDVCAQIVKDSVSVHSTEKSDYKVEFDRIPTVVRRNRHKNTHEKILL